LLVGSVRASLSLDRARVAGLQTPPQILDPANEYYVFFGSQQCLYEKLAGHWVGSRDTGIVAFLVDMPKSFELIGIVDAHLHLENRT
jgi:hypothetical protein